MAYIALRKTMVEDSKLINDLQSHQRKLQDEALERLYFRNLSTIESFVNQNSGTTEDSHEVLQDALVVVFQSVRKQGFQLTAKLDTFLYGIAKNVWYNRLRKMRREIKTIPIQDAHAEPTFPNMETASQTISEKWLQFIRQMSPKCRRLLTVIYVEEKDINETMVAMEYKSEQAVRNKKSNCMQKLRALIQGNNQSTGHV